MGLAGLFGLLGLLGGRFCVCTGLFGLMGLFGLVGGNTDSTGAEGVPKSEDEGASDANTLKFSI